MKNEPKDTYAFPHKCQNLVYHGMTLRDYFAAKAMQGIVQGDPIGELDDATVAKEAYTLADAMLAERERD